MFNWRDKFTAEINRLDPLGSTGDFRIHPDEFNGTSMDVEL